ncbi:zinc finger and SCAN domain-containing protein 2-like [Maniola jurtina]|uniref:zinc finger and SCAN domain-containing protein 2-like n=1 Tax=Maniola jurtina TaxID=191418 RepID=UPI001E6893B7|nr:zinc finger and SCAN domain-containing protein 2-like [Maniola jurtina]
MKERKLDDGKTLSYFTIEVDESCNDNETPIVKTPERKTTLLREIHKHHNNFEVLAASSNATPIRSHNGLFYTCCFCADKYTNPADLKTHTLTRHDSSEDRRKFMRKQHSPNYVLKLDITQLTCRMCDKSIETLEELLDHVQNEHKMFLYTDIKNNIFPLKFGGEKLQCAICHLDFQKYKVLIEHMHSHYRNYECEVCGFGCINRKTLFTHKGSHKTGSFECSTCNKMFVTQQKLQQHFYAIHKHKSLVVKCPICDERFKSSVIKDRHMVAVHDMTPEIHKCLACEKTFTTPNALNSHTRRIHLVDKRYPCTECEMTFFSGVELTYHMAKHTGKKEFQCDICSKRFSRKCGLFLHMHIHTNVKRFTCTHCGRAFVHRNSWRAHVRSTHGEVAYNATFVK